MCIDLVVDVALDQATWTVSGVRLEADDLADVLRQQDSDSAHLAAALLGAPIADCLTPLPSLLADLLRDTSAAP